MIVFLRELHVIMILLYCSLFYWNWYVSPLNYQVITALLYSIIVHVPEIVKSLEFTTFCHLVSQSVHCKNNFQLVYMVDHFIHVLISLISMYNFNVPPKLLIMRLLINSILNTIHTTWHYLYLAFLYNSSLLV